MLVLRLGDPHVKVNNLAESHKLLEFTETQAKLNKVDRIEILGDLFHTHAVIRLEVLAFWEYWLERLSSQFVTMVLVGNHDQSGDHKKDLNVLSIFKRINNNLFIIDQPMIYDGNGVVTAYVPYIHDHETFNSVARGLYSDGARVLVCHQTFNGAKYESGIYAPDGFDPDATPYRVIVSGHIHSRQRFGKVIYPGTAKWDTNSDANETKGLWLVSHAEDGTIGRESFIDTSEVCIPIRELSWKEGTEQPLIPEGRVTLELIGSSEWVKQQKDKLKGKCGLKSKITDKARLKQRKAGKGLLDFITNFETVGVTREQVIEYMKENNLV